VDSNEAGGCAYGETYEGHADMYDEVVNNLVVSNTGSGYVFIRRGNRSLSNGCSAANVHHNGKYQLSAGGLGVAGYGDFGTVGTFAAMFSPTTGLGASDVTANPQFVDDTRGITTWAVARGYSVSGTYNGRVTDAYAAIAAAPRTRIPDLITWCFAGFAPQNIAFHGTADDSGDIGAVPVVISGTGALTDQDSGISGTGTITTVITSPVLGGWVRTPTPRPTDRPVMVLEDIEGRGRLAAQRGKIKGIASADWDKQNELALLVLSST